MNTLTVDLGDRSYPITIERGGLRRAGTLLNLRRRVLLVTDSGVPPVYSETVAAACDNVFRTVIPQGEATKSLASAQGLWELMLDNGFSRGDCVVAVGGGMCGDLAGFAAACYMRGIAFYNIPTTLLSQVDSSIGGKTAVDLNGVKNIIGTFYQPHAVLIDPDVLETLPCRLRAEGMIEAVKMALVFDAELFDRLTEAQDPYADLDDVLSRVLALKQTVVEQDERDTGRRNLLNFGHTLGHGVESASRGALYHGECVGLGMLPMCSPSVRERLLRFLERLGAPVIWRGDTAAVWQAVLHDKKLSESGINAVFVDEPGRGYLRRIQPEELRSRLEGAWKS